MVQSAGEREWVRTVAKTRRTARYNRQGLVYTLIFLAGVGVLTWVAQWALGIPG